MARRTFAWGGVGRVAAGVGWRALDGSRRARKYHSENGGDAARPEISSRGPLAHRAMDACRILRLAGAMACANNRSRRWSAHRGAGAVSVARRLRALLHDRERERRIYSTYPGGVRLDRARNRMVAAATAHGNARGHRGEGSASRAPYGSRHGRYSRRRGASISRRTVCCRRLTALLQNEAANRPPLFAEYLCRAQHAVPLRFC